MSGALPDNTPVVSIKEPIVDIDRKQKYAVLLGPKVVQWQHFPAASVSNSNVTISCNQPSRETIIDRRVYLQLTLAFSFTGSTTGGNLLQLGTYDGFRAYPISSTITSQSMSIGSQVVTQGNFNQYWPYLLRYHNFVNNRQFDYSITPSMLDQYQEYADWATYGSARNPLSLYGENSTESSRGAFNSQITSLSNTTTTASFNVVITEPIFMSPFIFARDDHEKGLIGVDTMSYQAQFGDLTRMWCHSTAGGSTLSGLTVSITAAQLLFRQLSPSDVQSIPRSLSYPYFNIVSYTSSSNVGAVAAGASATLVSSVITVPGVPRRIYVFAREQQQDLTYAKSDAMFNISASTVLWETQTFLSQATPVDLYRMSVKNGCSLSWPQWTFFVGSIMCIEMGSDIGLPPTQAPGKEGKFQLQVQVTTKNIGSRTITPTLYVVAVFEGEFQIVGGTAYISQNVLTGMDVMDARPGDDITYKTPKSIFGGDFFKDLGRIAKKVLPVVRAIKPLAVAGLSHAFPAAAPAIAGIGSLIGGRKGGKKKGKAKRMYGRGLEIEEVEEEQEEESPDGKEEWRDDAESDSEECEEEQEVVCARESTPSAYEQFVKLRQRKVRFAKK